MNTERLSMLIREMLNDNWWRAVIVSGGFAIFGGFYYISGFLVSSDCTSLANKVLSSSSNQAVRDGGQLTSFSNLRQISGGDGKIICEGYFEGNGVYRSDNYTISEDRSGVYWQTPGRIEYTQEIQIPQHQVQIEFQEQ